MGAIQAVALGHPVAAHVIQHAMGLLLLQVAQVVRQVVRQDAPVHAVAVAHHHVEVDVPPLAVVVAHHHAEAVAHQTVRLVAPEHQNLRDALLARIHVVENAPKPVQIIAARIVPMGVVPDAIMAAKIVVTALVAPRALVHVQAVA